MNIINIGDNQTEIITSKAEILVSYSTPVGINFTEETEINGHEYDPRIYVTDQFHSVTTSRHINQWLGYSKDNLPTIPQADLDQYFREI